VEPFDLLDVQLLREMSFDLLHGHNAIVYVLQGNVIVRADPREQQVPSEHVLALHGEGQVRFHVAKPAHFLILSGAAIHEPHIAHGSFIMNDRSQIDAALTRYRAGQMGDLAPLSEG
jgi:hypothetical protein